MASSSSCCAVAAVGFFAMRCDLLSIFGGSVRLPNLFFRDVRLPSPPKQITGRADQARPPLGCVVSAPLTLVVAGRSTCLSVCLSACLLPVVSLSVCLSVCLSVYLFIHLSVCLSVCLCLSVCPSVRLSVCLSVCLTACMSARLSVSLSVCL